jgi:multiple antibiotic resistance protein
MLDHLFNSFITLLVVIDPVGVAATFVALTREMTLGERRRTALRGVLIAGAILYAFAFMGNGFLLALGIGLGAFRIAGGILLFFLAIEMILARPAGHRTTPLEQAEAGEREDISVFPLAIPLIAGPGAITSTVLLMGHVWHSPGLAAGLLVTIALALAVTLLALLLATRLVGLLGVTGTNVVGRVLGIVLAALAVQFVLDGLQGAGFLS